MFQGLNQKIVLGVILVFLLVVFELNIIYNSDEPYTVYEEVQYISVWNLNPLAGKVNYTDSDEQQPNLPTPVNEKTEKQQPEPKQEVIKQRSEEVKKSVKKEPVEKAKQNDKTQPPGNINQGDKTQPPGNINQGDKTQPPGNINQGDKTQLPGNIGQGDKTQPPGNINQGDKKQQPLPAATGNPLQQLVNLVGTNNGAAYNSYLKKLSTSQLKSVLNQLGVSNLTLQKSQMKFLSCGGKPMLKQLKGKKLNSSVHIPSSFHHCKNMSFKSSGPSVALVSYPGSGNSWVRQLLESATGIYTGAVYCDTAYVAAGMIGEFIDTRNVLAIKTHLLPPMRSNLLVAQYDKAIYVVRSPFSAILAEHNRALAERAPKQYGNAHTAEVNYKYVNNLAWNKEVKGKSQEWKVHITRWLKVTEIPVLVVGYENLINNTYTEVKRMLDFLGHPYSKEDVLCAIKSPSENFHRKHTKDSHVFSPELKQIIINNIKQVNVNLLKHNISLL